MDTEEIRFKEEVFRIVGAAMEVHNTLGTGFSESVYAEAFGTELRSQGIPFDREVGMEVVYKGQPLGKTFRADFLIQKKILVELKAMEYIGDLERAQLLNYLKVSGLTLGLIINFGAFPKLEWQRIAN